jgi:hypothetical protein
VSRGTLDPVGLSGFAYATVTLCGPGFPSGHSARLQVPCDSPQPRTAVAVRFGLFRFRSPLLAESRLISLPGATEMFQFAPFPPADYEFICRSSGIHPDGVSPFGHPRIVGYLLLPAAFRSLSRPSSAIGAKAFTLRS